MDRLLEMGLAAKNNEAGGAVSSAVVTWPFDELPLPVPANNLQALDEKLASDVDKARVVSNPFFISLIVVVFSPLLKYTVEVWYRFFY